MGRIHELMEYGNVNEVKNHIEKFPLSINEKNLVVYTYIILIYT
jgi:hypothetical protein